MGRLLRWLDPLLDPEACLPPVSVEPFPNTPTALLKRLDILLRQRLGGLAGERPSIARGQGLDFRNLRQYAPGDDIRKMDWKVLARTLVPHIREYQEEKQWTVWLVMDLTPSMHFGRRETKARYALDLAGLLGLLACREGDRLGAFVITGEEAPEVIAPGQGEGHLHKILHRMLLQANQPCRRPVPEHALSLACGKLAHIVKKDSTVLFFSDFIPLSRQWPRDLGRLSRDARLVYLLIRDVTERAFPAGLGRLPLTDPETGQVGLVDTDNKPWVQTYREEAQAREREALEILQQSGEAVALSTEDNPLDALLSLAQKLKGTHS